VLAKRFSLAVALTTALVALVAVWAFAVVPSGAAMPGAANSLASTVLPPPTPYIQHVVVVVLENEELTTVWGHAPFERYLAANYGNATSYFAACHPSAPNYLALFAAVANECGSDSWNNYTNKSLGFEFDNARLTWGQYAENLPSTACSNPAGATSGLFATRHVPALFFSSVLKNQSYCNSHVLSSNSFNSSVANGTLRNYSFYTPNLCDDGHNGCGGNTTYAQMTAQGDAWLKHWLGPILNHTGKYSSSAERAEINHTAFFITWDEGVASNAGFAVAGVTGGDNYLWCGQNGESGDAVCGGHIFTAVVSPYSRHATLTTKDSPYGLCRTVEWLFHLNHLGNPGGMDNQTGFPVMKSMFNFTANG
jgi:phosphatidylinositol-3-phosphatase